MDNLEFRSRLIFITFGKTDLLVNLLRATVEGTLERSPAFFVKLTPSSSSASCLKTGVPTIAKELFCPEKAKISGERYYKTATTLVLLGILEKVVV